MSEVLDRKLRVLTTVKEIGGEGSRTLRFRASTESKDRANDRIDVEGWELGAYNANPVFLWAHSHDGLPIGKTIATYKNVREKALDIDVYFPTIAELNSDPNNPSEHALFVDTVYLMYKSGILNAVSVGFRGLEYDMTKDEGGYGIHFKRQELYEVSGVPVPCNAEALAVVRGMKSISKKGVALVEEVLMTDPADKGGSGQNKKEGSDLSLKILDIPEVKAVIADAIKAGISATTEKINARFSKKTLAALEEIRDTMKGCHDKLAALMAEGEKPEDEENEEGDKGSKDDGSKGQDTAVDLSTLSVEKAMEILR